MRHRRLNVNRVHVVIVDHGTPDHVNLLLRSLLATESDLTELSVTVLVNGLGQAAEPWVMQQLPYDWAQKFGVHLRSTGYTLNPSVNTHGELLRQEILRFSECDFYLTLDSDVCFLFKDTIKSLVQELTSDPTLFGLQATWLGENRQIVPSNPSWLRETLHIREEVTVPSSPQNSGTSDHSVRPADRIHPFCALLRRSRPLIRAVQYLGCSAATTHAERGARYFNTLGLLTEVMRTHDLKWKIGGTGVVHFEGASWRDLDQAALALRCGTWAAALPPLPMAGQHFRSQEPL